MNLDFMLSEAFLQGAMGGGTLGLGRMIVTLIQMDHTNSNNKYWRFLVSHVLAAVLFALLGAVMSFSFEGKAGNVMQGISGMALLALLAGNMLPSHNAPTAPSHAQNSGTP